MAEGSVGSKPKRITLDGQLIDYWEREAKRLDEMAKNALFRWTARGYARRADRARGLAQRSRAREEARRHKTSVA